MPKSSENLCSQPRFLYFLRHVSCFESVPDDDIGLAVSVAIQSSSRKSIPNPDRARRDLDSGMLGYFFFYKRTYYWNFAYLWRKARGPVF